MMQFGIAHCLSLFKGIESAISSNGLHAKMTMLDFTTVLKNKFFERTTYNYKKNCYQLHVERAGGYCDLPPPSPPFYTDAVYYFYVSI